MLRLIALCFCLLPTAQGVAAQQMLQQLDTGHAARGFDGVGRLEIGGRGFCTGALIAPNLVLTAAHCLFDRDTGRRFPAADIEFRAGWRNGRAEALGNVRIAVVHPKYKFKGTEGIDRVHNDLALLELQRPMRGAVRHFSISGKVRKGSKVGIVSYAFDRAEAPSIQRGCKVLGRQNSVYVMDCDVDFGSSGAPVFHFDGDKKQVVSVVSAKATLNGSPVALGMALDSEIELLRAEIANGATARRKATGAKFLRVGDD